MNASEAAAQFLQYCAWRGLSARTLTAYSWALRRLERHCQVIPTEARELWPVLGDRQLSPESRRSLYALLHRYFGWLEREHGQRNPLAGVERPRRRGHLPRVLTEEEISRMVAEARSPRDQAMLMVLLDTGIRLGELAGLAWGDVGMGHLVVRGKAGERRVPLSVEVHAALLWLGGGEHLWVGRRGPLTVHGVRLAVVRLFRRAGITGRRCGPHTLRHTFATHYCRSGGNVRILQEILGHQALATTMIYVHLAGRDVAVDHAQHSPVHTLGLAGRLTPGKDVAKC